MQLFHSLILENAQAREEDTYRVTKQLCALNHLSRPEEYEFEYVYRQDGSINFRKVSMDALFTIQKGIVPAVTN